MRIALIHALRHSPPPIVAAFARLWPEPTLVNLLDDSLSADLARDGALTPAMTDRFLRLATYVVDAGADAILFTCSAFGPCIDACAAAYPNMPVLKPNEAMIEEAAAYADIGLLSTFAANLISMPPEFPPSTRITPRLAQGALAALDAGDVATHDRLVIEASRDLSACEAVVLGQFSISHLGSRVAEVTGRPVLTTPDSAVRKLRRLMA